MEHARISLQQIGISKEKRELLQLAGGQPQQQIAQQLRIAEQNAEATV
jgi:DNA-binding CsgD family transcriptional regulator